MHGDKKWIWNHAGKLVKSSNRSFVDWRSDLNRLDWKVLKEEQENCPECKAMREYYGRWVYPTRYLRIEGTYKMERRIDYSKEEFIVPPECECEYHRELYSKRWNRNPYHKKSSRYAYDPSWWKRMYNRKERAMVNNIIRKARYEEDRYDDLTTQQMVKLGYYW